LFTRLTRASGSGRLFPRHGGHHLGGCVDTSEQRPQGAILDEAADLAA